jgi:hypothetical protein
MMFDQQLIETVLLAAVGHQPHGHVFQNVLFRRGRPTKSEFKFSHAQQPEKNDQACPEKSCNSLSLNCLLVGNAAP